MMQKRSGLQAWAEQVRNEPLRMTNWPLLRKLCVVIVVTLVAGLVSDLGFGAGWLTAVSYGIGGLAAVALFTLALNRRFFVTRPPMR